MSPMTFLFDLASPYAYLSAERLAGRPDIDWQPVLLGAISAGGGMDPGPTPIPATLTSPR